MGVPEYQISAKFSTKYHLSVKIHDYQLTLEGIRGGGGGQLNPPPSIFLALQSGIFCVGLVNQVIVNELLSRAVSRIFRGRVRTSIAETK